MLAQLRGVRRGGIVDRGRVGRRGHLVHLGRVEGQPVGERRARACPALRSGESARRTARRPTRGRRGDQSTSEPDPSGPARGARASAMEPPVSPICGSSPRAWAASRRDDQLARDGRGQVGGVDVHLDARSGVGGCGHRRSRRPLLRESLGHGGVDVVLVEPAQLLGQQRRDVQPLSAMGRSGWPGEEMVASLPSSRLIRIGPCLVSSTTSVMPGPVESCRATLTLRRSASQLASRSALGLIRSAVTDADGHGRAVLVEGRGEQRAPGRQAGPGQVGVARCVRQAQRVHGLAACRG